jgi:hypothetical protein
MKAGDASGFVKAVNQGVQSACVKNEAGRLVLP